MNRPLIGSLLFLLIAPVQAEGLASAAIGVGTSLKVGTLGYADTDRPLAVSPYGGLAMSRFQFQHQADAEAEYAAEGESLGLFMDWYPSTGNFRLTLGYLANNAGPRLGSVDGPRLGATSPAANLREDLEVSDGAYLGLGWGDAVGGKGLGVRADVGVLYRGRAEIKPYERDGLGLGSTSPMDQVLEDYQPVMSFGLSYGF